MNISSIPAAAAATSTGAQNMQAQNRLSTGDMFAILFERVKHHHQPMHGMQPDNNSSNSSTANNAGANAAAGSNAAAGPGLDITA